MNVFACWFASSRSILGAFYVNILRKAIKEVCNLAQAAIDCVLYGITSCEGTALSPKSRYDNESTIYVSIL